MNSNNMSELLPSGRFPERDETVLYGLKAEYLQDSDSCAEDDTNTLEIETQDAGGGIYYIIKTQRWAFDNPEELLKVLNDFVSRFSPDKTYKT